MSDDDELKEIKRQLAEYQRFSIEREYGRIHPRGDIAAPAVVVSVPPRRIHPEHVTTREVKQEMAVVKKSRLLFIDLMSCISDVEDEEIQDHIWKAFITIELALNVLLEKDDDKTKHHVEKAYLRVHLYKRLANYTQRVSDIQANNPEMTEKERSREIAKVVAKDMQLFVSTGNRKLEQIERENGSLDQFAAEVEKELDKTVASELVESSIHQLKKIAPLQQFDTSRQNLQTPKSVLIIADRIADEIQSPDITYQLVNSLEATGLMRAEGKVAVRKPDKPTFELVLQQQQEVYEIIKGLEGSSAFSERDTLLAYGASELYTALLKQHGSDDYSDATNLDTYVTAKDIAEFAGLPVTDHENGLQTLQKLDESVYKCVSTTLSVPLFKDDNGRIVSVEDALIPAAVMTVRDQNGNKVRIYHLRGKSALIQFAEQRNHLSRVPMERLKGKGSTQTIETAEINSRLEREFQFIVNPHNPVKLLKYDRLCACTGLNIKDRKDKQRIVRLTRAKANALVKDGVIKGWKDVEQQSGGRRPKLVGIEIIRMPKERKKSPKEK